MGGLRIDKWLWFARFCKTRSLAQHLVEEGDVRLNNRPVGKTSATVQPGDELIFPQGRGWRRVMVMDLGIRRGPALEAQALYRELSPPDPPPDDWRG
jgi:ribosome-associated heat shock protein Hsp15